MADGYIIDPIETDPDVLELAAYSRLQSRWPSWTPSNNNLETWQISVLARMVAEAMDVASDVPPAIFKFLGQSIFGVPPIAATAARVATTWVVTDNVGGRTILADWLVTIDDPVNGPAVFRVVADVVMPDGNLSTGVGEVILEATDEGENSNELGGLGELATQYDPAISWVSSITMTSATGGGADEEDDDTYLNRLSRRLTLLTPRPILARDYEILSVDIAAQNGVDVRALAIDGYNPGDGTFNNERMVALYLINAETGANVTAPIKGAVDVALQAQREVNFIVTVNDPTRTTVDVTFAGKCLAGYVPADVEAAAEAAVTDYLQPQNYGRPVDEGASSLTTWVNKAILYHQDIGTILNTTPGFDRWTTLTIGLNGGGQSATDQTLAGAAPIAQPGVIAGTVTA
jgi:hypothetical protein